MKAPHQQGNDADTGEAKASGATWQKRTLVDNRHAMAAQRKLGEMMNSSPPVKQLRALANSITNSTRALAQRRKMSTLTSCGELDVSPSRGLDPCQVGEEGGSADSHAREGAVGAKAGVSAQRVSTLQPMVVQRLPETNPATVFRHYGANSDGCSDVVEAQVNATSNGGIPSVNPVGWSDVLAKAPRVKGQWVRFHLLHQHLGGDGSDTANLVPTSHGINTNPIWRDMEKEALGAAKKNRWVWWRTEVTYHPASLNYGLGFPSNINVQGKKWKNGAWVNFEKGKGNYDLALSPPTFLRGKVRRYIHEITGAQWKEIGVTNGSLINELVKNASEIKTFDDLYTKVYFKEGNNFKGIDKQIKAIDRAVLGNDPRYKIKLNED